MTGGSLNYPQVGDPIRQIYGTFDRFPRVIVHCFWVGNRVTPCMNLGILKNNAKCEAVNLVVVEAWFGTPWGVSFSVTLSLPDAERRVDSGRPWKAQLLGVFFVIFLSALAIKGPSRPSTERAHLKKVCKVPMNRWRKWGYFLMDIFTSEYSKEWVNSHFSYGLPTCANSYVSYVLPKNPLRFVRNVICGDMLLGCSERWWGRR